MSRQEALDVIDFLSKHFGVSTPRLEWVAWSVNGRYGHGRIQVGPSSWRGALPCLLHEFAHHLCHERRGLVRRHSPGYGGWVEHHGKDFALALIDVAAIWYGDFALYPWSTEYRSLRDPRKLLASSPRSPIYPQPMASSTQAPAALGVRHESDV